MATLAEILAMTPEQIVATYGPDSMAALGAAVGDARNQAMIGTKYSLPPPSDSGGGEELPWNRINDQTWTGNEDPNTAFGGGANLRFEEQYPDRSAAIRDWINTTVREAYPGSVTASDTANRQSRTGRWLDQHGGGLIQGLIIGGLGAGLLGAAGGGAAAVGEGTSGAGYTSLADLAAAGGLEGTGGAAGINAADAAAAYAGSAGGAGLTGAESNALFSGLGDVPEGAGTLGGELTGTIPGTIQQALDIGKKLTGSVGGDKKPSGDLASLLASMAGNQGGNNWGALQAFLASNNKNTLGNELPKFQPLPQPQSIISEPKIPQMPQFSQPFRGGF